MVKPMPYAELFPPEEEGYHPVAVVRTMFVEEIDQQVAATIVDHLQASDAPMRVAQLRVLGGAVADVPVDATAYAHRKSPIMVNVAAVDESPDKVAAHRPWVSGLAAALNQGDTGAYVGFVGDEGAARVRDAYPDATWQRLAVIKSRYDPTNLFRLNQNIPPAQ
jgi:FAD/FMN-containing dehydrogenase